LKVFPDVLLSNAYIILRPFFKPLVAADSPEVIDAKNWVFGSFYLPPVMITKIISTDLDRLGNSSVPRYLATRRGLGRTSPHAHISPQPFPGEDDDICPEGQPWRCCFLAL
jgi:hypothetical protein